MEQRLQGDGRLVVALRWYAYGDGRGMSIPFVLGYGGPEKNTLQGGGGFMGAIAEGMAWGVGSAVGHRAIDSMMGPRQVRPSQ